MKTKLKTRTLEGTHTGDVMGGPCGRENPSGVFLCEGLSMDHESIKSISSDIRKKLKVKCTVPDLIVLAQDNDPFYVGRDSHVAGARWFMEQWNKKPSHVKHIRGVHYAMLGQGIITPKGEVYGNYEHDWQYLNDVSKWARYLGMVESCDIEDRKTQEVNLYHDGTIPDPDIEVMEDLPSDFSLPAFPDPPGYEIYDFEGRQRYHLEIWIEKAEMLEWLKPFCERRGINLIVGQGEISELETDKLFERILKYQKPCRVFYLSDHDPKGEDMPVSISRKLEFKIHNHGGEFDVKLIHLMLTKEQCVKKGYDLPTVPIKPKENKKDAWEIKHGRGATEINALAVRHPGAFEEIISEAVLHYYDQDLGGNVQIMIDQISDDLDDIHQNIMDNHSKDYTTLKNEYKKLSIDFDKKFKDLKERIETAYHAIANELNEELPDIKDYPIPEAREGEEFSDGLYNSDRSYGEQLKVYKEYQQKPSKIDFEALGDLFDEYDN